MNWKYRVRYMDKHGHSGLTLNKFDSYGEAVNYGRRYCAKHGYMFVEVVKVW